MLCSSLELSQALSLNMLACCMITLAQSSDRMSEVENGSFSALGLLERSSWSVLSLEDMLMSIVQLVILLVLMVHKASPGCVDSQWSMWISVVCATAGGHASSMIHDVEDMLMPVVEGWA